MKTTKNVPFLTPFCGLHFDTAASSHNRIIQVHVIE